MRDCEIMHACLFCGGKRLGELGEAEGCKDRHDICIVREIEIETLVCGEGGGGAV